MSKAPQKILNMTYASQFRREGQANLTVPAAYFRTTNMNVGGDFSLSP